MKKEHQMLFVISVILFAFPACQNRDDTMLVSEKDQTEVTCEPSTHESAKSCMVLALQAFDRYNNSKPNHDYESLDLAVELAKQAYSQGEKYAPAAALLGVIYAKYHRRYMKLLDIVFWLEQGCPEVDSPSLKYNELIGAACVIRGDADYFFSGNYLSTGKVVLKAAEYYERGIRENYGLAYASLGYVYETEAYYKSKEGYDKKAMALYTKAANELNDPRSMYLLAFNYHEGIGVDVNMDESIKWYQKSARLGYTLAIESLGVVMANKAKPNFEQCYLWGSIAEIRALESAVSARYCAPKLDAVVKEKLFAQAKIMSAELGEAYEKLHKLEMTNQIHGYRARQ